MESGVSRAEDPENAGKYFLILKIPLILSDWKIPAQGDRLQSLSAQFSVPSLKRL